ncbi:hypothetical protein NEF87_001993 [Candidatus Lokiarchaeum ossiferum]|uniref:NurA domain-containing protein n=1 Tax=Candidatus Lokiarchaeum ossiferum TaxID=2951803 RepID=A0ABY6HQT4_9ARCH|nr:hypothetical protein NEF87_001993 [Candidatus Lokiarchaeum sp. B-35]
MQNSSKSYSSHKKLLDSTRKSLKLNKISKTSSSLNRPEINQEKNKPDFQIPQFFSKESLLTLNMAVHVESIFQYAQNQEEFLEILSSEFCRNSKLDLSTFSSAGSQPFLENRCILPITPYTLPSLNGIRIAAVDGGLGFRQFMGLQITLIKVAVVMYEFKSSQKTTIYNFPPLHREENYCFYSDQGAFEENSGKILAGLRRTISENSMLLSFLKTNPEKPDIVILDGSLNFPPLPISAHNKKTISEHYQTCVESFIRLYQYCNQKRINLIGSIKDTHSIAFRDLIKRSLPFFLSKMNSAQQLKKISYRKYLDQFFDSTLFFKILQPFERTSIIAAESTTIPKSISKATPLKFPLMASYVQLSSFDIPLRLEFLGSEDPASSIQKFSNLIRILYPLSNINPQCTLPIPQLEAHLRAHLREEEMEVIVRQLKTQYQVKKSQSLSKQWINEKFSQKKAHFSTFLDSRHDRMDNLF